MSSVVDAVLARHGLEWKLYPYRIVDKATGTVLSTGPHFDLRDKSLQRLRQSLERKRNSQFK